MDCYEPVSYTHLESGKNSHYLELLPSAARKGITLTTIYGWKPGAALPVSGINEDDYKIATQIILWEYQQQLRTCLLYTSRVFPIKKCTVTVSAA